VKLHKCKFLLYHDYYLFTLSLSFAALTPKYFSTIINLFIIIIIVIIIIIIIIITVVSGRGCKN